MCGPRLCRVWDTGERRCLKIKLYTASQMYCLCFNNQYECFPRAEKWTSSSLKWCFKEDGFLYYARALIRDWLIAAGCRWSTCWKMVVSWWQWECIQIDILTSLPSLDQLHPPNKGRAEKSAKSSIHSFRAIDYKRLALSLTHSLREPADGIWHSTRKKTDNIRSGVNIT